ARAPAEDLLRHRRPVARGPLRGHRRHLLDRRGRDEARLPWPSRRPPPHGQPHAGAVQRDRRGPGPQHGPPGEGQGGATPAGAGEAAQMTEGSVALVTNGMYGVGREIVRSLDAAGLRVAVGARPAELDDGALKAPGEAVSV